MTRLHRLYRDEGQSPWLDNLRRESIESGRLRQMIGDGVRGLTSNPSIFEEAITGSAAYDDQFGQLIEDGADVESAYWELVKSDIRSALGLLRPTFDDSDGLDGYVSVEVDPSLARDCDGTVAAARSLHRELDAPNLYVKVPGTEEGLGAIEQLIGEGHSVNVTLLFSIERYRAVMDAYLSGLEAAEGDLSGISSVASFFISRTETEVDRRLEEIGTDDALALRGMAAVAQGRVAYELFDEVFSGPRWDALVRRGAHRQRPLWASTSTKNPAYPDTKYVDSLIGPDTVNTMPNETLDAFADHGTVARTVDDDVEAAHRILADIGAAGVDLDDVARVLEDDGIDSFQTSFDDLLDALRAKARHDR